MDYRSAYIYTRGACLHMCVKILLLSWVFISLTIGIGSRVEYESAAEGFAVPHTHCKEPGCISNPLLSFSSLAWENRLFPQCLRVKEPARKCPVVMFRSNTLEFIEGCGATLGDVEVLRPLGNSGQLCFSAVLLGIYFTVYH